MAFGLRRRERGFLSLERFPEARTYPGVLILCFDASFYYANTSYLEEWLIKAVTGRPDLR